MQSPISPPVRPARHVEPEVAMSQWWSTAPCTHERCLTEPRRAPGVLRRSLRYAGAVAALPAGLALPMLPRSYRPRMIAAWARVVSGALGVRLEVPPLPAAGTGRGVLVVANHISWLDVPLLLACRPGRMVAKREIVGYPGINVLASLFGTIVIDRDRLRSLPGLVADVAAVLRSGATVVVFPEATTWCGQELGEFRPAFFQAAVDAGAVIQPVALRYRLETGTVTTRPAYIGEESLLASVRRVVADHGVVAEAVVLPAIVPPAAAADAPAGAPYGRSRARRVLARRARTAIAEALRSAGTAGV